MKIKETRSPELSRLAGKIPEITVTVGIHDQEGSRTHDREGGPMTIAAIGEIHEFGLGQHRRSFIRDWADQEKYQNKSDIEAEVRNMHKRSPQQTADRIALRMQGRIQKRMTVKGTFKANAESTIRQKGSSMPLIDHGILKAAILGKGSVK